MTYQTMQPSSPQRVKTRLFTYISRVARDDDRVPEPLATLEELRRSVLVILRARRWLANWRAASSTPWDATDSTTMTANAVELSALTEFVTIQRRLEAAHGARQA